MPKAEEAKPREIPFSWMLRSKIATKTNLDALFRVFGAKRVLPELYYLRPLVMGSNFLDVREAFSTIHSWEDWVDAWNGVGEKREIRGDVALDEGLRVTARDNFLFAAAAYHMGQFPLYDELERKREVYEKCARCYAEAAELLDPPAEPVKIRFHNHRLPGYLRVPPSRKVVPVVVLVCGADSSKEEMHFFANAFVERGIGVLTYDGPGTGETWDKLAMIDDYERVGRSLVNFIEKDDRLDRTRIAMLGLSYGGNLALRIAAHEKRLAAVISISGPYDPSSYAEVVMPVIRDQVKLMLKDDSQGAFRRWAKTFSIRGLVERIEAPLLVIGGGEDVLIPGDDAKKIFDEARCEKKLLWFTEGNHLCADYAYDLVPKVEEWMMSIGFLGRRR